MCEVLVTALSSSLNWWHSCPLISNHRFQKLCNKMIQKRSLRGAMSEQTSHLKIAIFFLLVKQNQKKI